MKRTLPFLTFLILACQHPHSNTGLPKNFTPVEKTALQPIPQAVLTYLQKNLPGWTIPDTSEYCKAWWSFFDKHQIPYFTATDLNDDGQVDYAFILKNSSYLRIVILSTEKDSFTHWISEDFKESFKEKIKDIQFGLAVEPPGRTDCIIHNKEQSLLLQTNGIAIMAMEQKYMIFYRENGSFHSFKLKERPGDFLVQ